MGQPRAFSALLLFLCLGLGALATSAGASAGCNADGRPVVIVGVGGSPVSPAGSGGQGGSVAPAPDDGFGGLGFAGSGQGGRDAGPRNPCGTACGAEERCDADHLGLDDDCDGEVDELCTCSPGQAHACFKGDPSYRNAPGCFAGTAYCAEAGIWGPCIGGVHATEACFAANAAGCHPMQAAPFADVNLKDGTGTFSADAAPGSEVWRVTCPDGVRPCPAVAGASPPDDFKPLQSGEYAVTYTKRAPGGGVETCTYPLFVGAPGLRVELEWEHDLGGTGVDLDLHLHQPDDTQPWSISGSPVDCGFANCTIRHLSLSNNAVRWFSDHATPPEPVSWYLSPIEANNTCFHAPRGAGLAWQGHGRGCHNPRLDIDNITCNPAQTDPNSDDFCAPENINLDFPPLRAWTRIGVHYYSSHGQGYSVHPRLKVFCHGALAATLGPRGFYDPEAPVTFAPEDTSSRYWLVADVAFTPEDECREAGCVVVPLYQDATTRTPLLTTRGAVQSSLGPPYPAPLSP